MKHYCVLLVNETTGIIDHCMSSSEPIPDSDIPIPQLQGTTWRVQRTEFDSVEYVRAGDTRKALTMEGTSAATKRNPNANVILNNVPEAANIQNLKKVTTF